MLQQKEEETRVILGTPDDGSNFRRITRNQRNLKTALIPHSLIYKPVMPHEVIFLIYNCSVYIPLFNIHVPIFFLTR
ncbi:hypothetical protein ANTQUA_LOCUS8466 [Anthophora quadrimaculata]